MTKKMAPLRKDRIIIIQRARYCEGDEENDVEGAGEKKSMEIGGVVFVSKGLISPSNVKI